MPVSQHHSHRRKWLFGVPKKSAPPYWWRIFFWPSAMERHKVPAYLRSAGMYCPTCRKRQPFSDRCAFCNCDFSCFVVINGTTPSRTGRQSNGNGSPSTIGRGVDHHGLLARTRTYIPRFSKSSLRARMIAASSTFLLLAFVVVGMGLYQSHLQKNYSQNYVLALYGIKSGMHLAGVVCDGKYQAWKDGVSSDATTASRGVDPRAVADLKAVKAEINSIMGGMGTPSTEYVQAARKLQNLYAIYENMHSIITKYPGSLPTHRAEIVAVTEEFSTGIENIKADLPVPLAEEFKKSGQKYDLRFMGAGK